MGRWKNHKKPRCTCTVCAALIQDLRFVVSCILRGVSSRSRRTQCRRSVGISKLLSERYPLSIMVMENASDQYYDGKRSTWKRARVFVSHGGPEIKRYEMKKKKAKEKKTPETRAFEWRYNRGA